jgi:hypothetical protein
MRHPARGRRRADEMVNTVDKITYADGIGTIAVIGGTVRFDLMVLSPTEKDARGQPAAAFQEQIVMSLDNFMHAAEKIQEAVNAVTRMNRQTGETAATNTANNTAKIAPAATAGAPPAATPASEPTPPKRPFP